MARFDLIARSADRSVDEWIRAHVGAFVFSGGIVDSNQELDQCVPGRREVDVIGIIADRDSEGAVARLADPQWLINVRNRCESLAKLAKCRGSGSVEQFTLSLIHISEPTRQAEISYAV